MNKILLGIVGIALIAAAGYFWYQERDEAPSASTSLHSPLPSQSPPMAAPKTHRDIQYNFSFTYPSDFHIEVEDPFSKYGNDYPLRVIRVIPPYTSYEDIEIIVHTGGITERDDEICTTTSGKIGKRQISATEIHCGDAGVSNMSYQVLLSRNTVLRISMITEGNRQNAIAIPENQIQSILDSFEL